MAVLVIFVSVSVIVFPYCRWEWVLHGLWNLIVFIVINLDSNKDLFEKPKKKNLLSIKYK